MIKLKKGDLFTVTRGYFKVNGIYEYIRKEEKTIVAMKEGKIHRFRQAPRVEFHKYNPNARVNLWQRE